MARNKIVIENYGLNPPENSIPFWEDNNAFDEDKIVFQTDFKTSLQKLTSTEREIIQLCSQGYSVREIASIIDIPTMTVQGIKERAISKLKEMMNGKDSIHSIFA